MRCHTPPAITYPNFPAVGRLGKWGSLTTNTGLPFVPWPLAAEGIVHPRFASIGHKQLRICSEATQGHSWGVA